ncbi:hypothetical protein EKK58_01635 [Candidatus Dependentiae bacterium]|nr:MAG: hypothetical protein EKK58_01635 [Candidatus Dependentiae bacterium]
MKKRNLLFTFYFFIFMSLLFFCKPHIFTVSFNNVLNYYGFTTAEKKKAFRYLLEQASTVNEPLQIPFSKTQHDIEIVKNIAFIVKKTQEQFVQRNFQSQKAQERWQVAPPAWIMLDQNTILNSLQELGMIDAIKQKTTQTDALCILGSTGPDIKKRIKYALALIKNETKPQAIILLAGQRFVTEHIDGSKKKLKKIARCFALPAWQKLTETHLIAYYYKKSFLYKHQIPDFIIDTPENNNTRPTTETTLIKLSEWLQEHPTIKHITFISNQPYVHYQQAVIDFVCKKHNINIQYQVVGPKASSKNSLSCIIESLQGLGSYLWAATPVLLLEIGIKEIDNSLLEAYAHNNSMQMFLVSHFEYTNQ